MIYSSMKNMRKRYLYILSIVLIVVAAFFYYKTRVPDRPNIVFIILDAARADHFSCYGYPKNTTPNIDRIAKEGVIFKNNFSQATYTISSMSKIFSSRYFIDDIIQNDSWMWGIKYENPESIFRQPDPQQILLTECLSFHNYRTAIFSQHPFVYNRTPFLKQFDKDIRITKRREIDLDEDPKTNELISETLSWIKKNKNQRFFIYWHLMFPHEKYPNGVEDKEFLSGIDEKTIETVRKKIKYRGSDGAEIFNDKEITCLIGLYDSNLRYADALVGALYERLKTLGVLDKTLIIITADHGEYLGEHDLLFHGGRSWDSVIKVPLIMAYPPLLPQGLKVEGMTESIDIMPTILDICNMKVPKNKSLDGVNLLGYLRRPDKGKDAVFTGESIRTNKYKYISGGLYDIQDDPEEKNNIIDREPAVGKGLEAQFMQTMQPYIERYKKSTRKTPPDYAFYFPAPSLHITPEHAIETYELSNKPISVLLNEPLPDKAWVRNKHYQNLNRRRIYRVPNNATSPPITMSTDLPNGAYGIYILLAAPDGITHPVDEFGLRYRFNAEGPFGYPKDMQLFKNGFYYYLYLGEAKVDNNKFSLQIDFQPPDKKLYIIQHIKFVPAMLREKTDTDEDEFIEDEEFRKKREALKSLGYL